MSIYGLDAKLILAVAESKVNKLDFLKGEEKAAERMAWINGFAMGAEYQWEQSLKDKE